MQIKDLVEGTSVDGLVCLVEKLETGMAKNGKPFLRLTVRDETGSMPGVMWDQGPQPWLKEGTVITANAEVGSYQGAPQLKYSFIDLSSADPARFVKRTKFDVEKLWGHLVELVNGFTEPLTKYVAEEILLKHASVIELLKKAPAAKGVHNAWHGGLLEHIWSLCTIAEPIIKHYQRAEYYPGLSRDKVLFGLMLHDAGKIVEYDFSGPTIGYTLLGQLTPHIVLGPSWVFEAAGRWWTDRGDERSGMTSERYKLERAHLMHILAAHHGQIEWGSPVKPATAEAVLVHHLDNLDSKMMHAFDFILGKQGQIPGLSERSWIEKVSYLQPARE